MQTDIFKKIRISINIPFFNQILVHNTLCSYGATNGIRYPEKPGVKWEG
jgi:C4-type Zn-finger protein